MRYNPIVALMDRELATETVGKGQASPTKKHIPDGIYYSNVAVRTRALWKEIKWIALRGS